MWESDGWGEVGRWKDANLTATGSSSAPPPPPPPPPAVKQREQRG